MECYLKKNHMVEFKASVAWNPDFGQPTQFCKLRRKASFDFRMVSDLKLLVDNRRISIVHQMENQFWSDLGY